MTVAVLGGGVMGEAVLAGLLRADQPTAELVVSERQAARAAQLRERYGVDVVDSAAAVKRADAVLVVVKPQDMAAVLDEIAPEVRPGQLIVSLAAGVTTAFIEARLPERTAVVRAMPNTPALVGAGMTAISAGTGCDDAQLREAQRLLAATGQVIVVPEQQQDAVTAISGSGPAYVFYVVEAMIEAGVHLGLSRPTATELVVQTLAGAATLLRETGEHPTVLRERVTSPAGTTAAALRKLDEGKVRAHFLAAVQAAHDRSRALSS